MRTLKMLLINCSKKCIIVATAVANQGATFSTTDTRVYTTVLTLWTHDNAKTLEQLKYGFKRAITGIKINLKYQQKTKSIFRLLN